MTIDQKIQELQQQIATIQEKINLLQELQGETPSLLSSLPPKTSQRLTPPQIRQEAIDFQKQFQTPPELTDSHPGTYKGKPATIVEEFIGTKVDKKNYYSGKDPVIS